MRSTSVVSAAALCLVSACADSVPVQPTTAALSAFSASASARADEQFAVVNPAIADIPAQFGAPDGDFTVANAQLLYDVNFVNDASPTLVLANDRLRVTQAAWVPGDPRRGGHRGLKWGYLGANVPVPMFDAGVPGFIRAATASELEGALVSAVQAWDDVSCSSIPVERLFPGQPGMPDIIQVGWQPASWFIQNFPPNGAAIIGVTLTAVFVQDLVSRIPTDIDGNGKPDIAFQQIVYNAGKLWSNDGPVGTTDMFSIIAHETGHGFGLDHFGKVFVTKKNVRTLPDGTLQIDVDDIKYAPKALMNAVYVAGRYDIAGTDRSSFCQLWAGL